MSDKRYGSGCGVRKELDILHAFHFGGKCIGHVSTNQ